MADNILGILSDETFAQRMDTLCAIIAKAGTEEDGLGAGTWKDIQRIVRRGLAPKLFSVGDQLRCKRGNETLVWDIIGIDHDIPSDKSMTHSMTLQLHDCFTLLQYDAKEAFYYTETGLTAGTYHFTVGQHPFVDSENGKTYQFTLTYPVPAGGHLVLAAAHNASIEGTNISSYANGYSDTVETVTLTSGTAGTNLGTVNTAANENFNSFPHAIFGSSNYAQSALKQYIGSTADEGAVWKPQTKFDRAPSWAANTAGFLCGMDENFLSVVGEVDKITALNTVSDSGGSVTASEKFFLLSCSEVYGGNNNRINEGHPYPYYSENSDLSAAGTGADSNRIKHLGGTAQNWVLRSPYTATAHSMRTVYPAGDLRVSAASASVAIAPACCII